MKIKVSITGVVTLEIGKTHADGTTTCETQDLNFGSGETIPAFTVELEISDSDLPEPEQIIQKAKDVFGPLMAQANGSALHSIPIHESDTL